MKESEFIRLVMPLRDRMFRYAQSLVLSSAEAEDVVHDLLERMWRDHERMELPQHVGAFVMTAVRNRCCDLLRRRQADVRRLALGVILGAGVLRKPYCYIDGRPVYDREEALQTTAYFEAFAALDAPDRLLDVWMDDQK